MHPNPASRRVRGGENLADELKAAAEAFDELYTELTLLQRHLVAARRDDGLPDAEARRLISRVKVFTAAAEAADQASAAGEPSPVQVTLKALKVRVTQADLDAELLLPVLRGLPRRSAFPLLAEFLQAAVERGHALDELLVDVTLEDLVGAPMGMGPSRAAIVFERAGFDSDPSPADLSSQQVQNLCAALRDLARPQPTEVFGRTRTPKPPDDGIGAADAVLRSWRSAVGRVTEPTGSAALAATRREGWPADAVQVATLLTTWARDAVAPTFFTDIGEFLKQNKDLPEAELIRLLRADANEANHEARYLPEEESREHYFRWYVLKTLADAIQAESKARGFSEQGPEAWSSQTPVSLARTAGRRVGELVAYVADEYAVPLLDNLPPDGDRR
jgi:hypothetical protein